MALRLSKSLKQETNSANGFDVLASKDYNLEEVSNLVDRKSASTPLRVQTEGKSSKTGGVHISDDASERIIMNSADAAKYLFRGEPSTDAYTPSITLRRPVVIWEEGTKPTAKDQAAAEGIYSEIYALTDEIRKLRDELSAVKGSIVSRIDFTDDGRLETPANAIPNAEAIFNVVNGFHVIEKYTETIDELTKNMYVNTYDNNKIIIESIDSTNYYNLNIGEEIGIHYDFDKIEGDFYSVKFGGNNGRK